MWYLLPIGDAFSRGWGAPRMVIVIGLWNFLLLGSTVTIGLNVALFQGSFSQFHLEQAGPRDKREDLKRSWTFSLMES